MDVQRIGRALSGGYVMLTIKVIGMAGLLLATPVLSSYAPTPPETQTFVVENSETVGLAPCLKWRPDILDLAITGLKNNAGESAPMPHTFLWQNLRLVGVPKNGPCEVLVADERLADSPVLSTIMVRDTDPLYSPNDVSGIYLLFEFKSDRKGERLFAGLILPLPAPEQELRGVPQLHT